MKQNIKKIVLSCITIIAPFLLMAQDTNTSKNVSMDFNWILIMIAFILLLPIYIMSKTFLHALKENIKKGKVESNTGKKTGVVIFLLSLSQLSEAKTFNAIDMSSNWLAWLLATVIIIETILIVFFSMQTIKLLNPSAEEEDVENSIATEGSRNWFGKMWDKMNRFKPLSEEGEIDTGHSYDGIRELDNVTPPWFITAFALTVVFAFVYLYRYHVAKSAPLQDEEYAIEMAQAEKDNSKILTSEANNIDENTVVMMGASDIEDGKKVFTQVCSACHGPTGGSMAGGVGPNLTDDYWIHGGSIQDVFKSIKYGWPEKGMISWKNNFSPKQMAQLSSFIKSIQGTNPPGAKEPQGELYKENAAAPAATDSASVKK